MKNSKIIGTLSTALSLGACASLPVVQLPSTPITLAQIEADAVAAAKTTCALDPVAADIAKMVAAGGLAMTISTVTTIVGLLCNAGKSSSKFGTVIGGVLNVTMPNGAVVTVHLQPLASHHFHGNSK